MTLFTPQPASDAASAAAQAALARTAAGRPNVGLVDRIDMGAVPRFALSPE
jgi:hypothetical protein